MNKLWSKREWINNTKWTKNKLQCIKILKRRLGFDLNKSLKHCYLKQSGKHKITSLKLVACILKFKTERNTLLNYQNCEENGYLRNINHIIKNKYPLPKKIKQTVHELIASFKDWKRDQ